MSTMFKLNGFELMMLCFVWTICYNYRVTCDRPEELMYAKTFLDGNAMRTFYRVFRDLTFLIVGQTSQRGNSRILQDAEYEFPCNTSGMRSATIPDSVHRLRPGKYTHHSNTPAVLIRSLVR